MHSKSHEFIRVMNAIFRKNYWTAPIFETYKNVKKVKIYSKVVGDLYG